MKAESPSKRLDESYITTPFHSIRPDARDPARFIITRHGCGCCSDDETATRKNIDAAIQETEDQLAWLRRLRKKL